MITGPATVSSPTTLPQRLGHALRPRKWLNQLHQAVQAVTRRIQITKVSQTFHAASETSQRVSAAWCSHSSLFHSHIEHQSPAATSRHRWQHSWTHHSHYPPLESKLEACLHPLGLYSQMAIHKPKHSITWYTRTKEYKEEKLLKKIEQEWEIRRFMKQSHVSWVINGLRCMWMGPNGFQMETKT